MRDCHVRCTAPYSAGHNQLKFERVTIADRDMVALARTLADRTSLAKVWSRVGGAVTFLEQIELAHLATPLGTVGATALVRLLYRRGRASGNDVQLTLTDRIFTDDAAAAAFIEVLTEPVQDEA